MSGEIRREMTEEQVLRYLDLADRKASILTSSGIHWKPEYEKEIKEIEQELSSIRKLFEKGENKENFVPENKAPAGGQPDVRGTEFPLSSMTMEERYTKAMGLLGYELTDTPLDSMATVTFRKGEKGAGQRTVRSDGWEGVGYVLEERLPGLKGKLASEIKALLYPKGNPEDALCAPEPEAPPKDSFMKREMMEERMNVRCRYRKLRYLHK